MLAIPNRIKAFSYSRSETLVRLSHRSYTCIKLTVSVFLPEESFPDFYV